MWHTAEAGGPEAQSSTNTPHDPAKFRDPECAQMFVQELRQIPQPSFGCHPDDHAHQLDAE
eukprot:5253189-Pyramimonas_sp.AAC.1